MVRIFTLLLVALLLPIQGYAAACAQICAIGGGHVPMALHAAAHEDHCDQHEGSAGNEQGDKQDDSGTTHGAGKCCQAHVFAIDLGAAEATTPVEGIAGATFIVRWTNFIPEEPSPPPIGTRPIA